MWCLGPILPQTLIDILADEEEETDGEDDEDFICEAEIGNNDD